MKSTLQAVETELLPRRNVFDNREYKLTFVEGELSCTCKSIDFWHLFGNKPYMHRVYDNNKMLSLLPNLARITPVRYN